MFDASPKMTAADAAIVLDMTLPALHRQLKYHQHKTFKNNNRVYFDFNTSKNLFGIDFDFKIIAFQVVKGGTGKTSLAGSFAARAVLYGARVLCIDLDQQGNLTQALGVDSSDKPVMIDILKGNSSFKGAIQPILPGLDLLPSRIENAILDKVLMLDQYGLDRVYADYISTIKKDYDLIIFDCPPALGSSVAAATLASDIVIAPITPDFFSLSGLKITYDEIEGLNKKYQKDVQIKILLNKFDQRNGLSSEVLKTILSHEIYGNKLCSTFIRSCQEIQNSIFKGVSIYSSLKNNPAKEDIDLLTQEILGIKEKIKKAKQLKKAVA